MFARFFRVMFFVTYEQIGNAVLATDARLHRFCRSVRQFPLSQEVEN